MIDLRNKAQALNQQAVLPLLPIDSVEARAGRIRRRRRLAALVVVIPVVGVAIGAFFITRHDGSRPAISIQPSTTLPNSAHAASLVPAGFLSAPPAGDRHTLVEWGWDGRRLRTLHLNPTVDCCASVSLSPDGTRLLVVGDTAQVLDLQGHVIAKGPDIDGMWADDSRHLCSLQPHSHAAGMPEGPADLLLVDPGHGARVVAQVPGYGPHTGPSIMRCSVRDDEAIVAQSTFGTSSLITAVRLSTGVKSIPSWAPPNPADGQIVSVSGDGHYALELRISSDSRGQVLDTRTGAVVAHLPGQPDNLSWDGHVALEMMLPSGQTQAVDWRTNAVVWRSAAQNPTCPCPAASYVMRTRPDTDDIALAVTNQPGQPSRQANLWLITEGRSALVDEAVRDGIV